MFLRWESIDTCTRCNSINLYTTRHHHSVPNPFWLPTWPPSMAGFFLAQTQPLQWMLCPSKTPLETERNMRKGGWELWCGIFVGDDAIPTPLAATKGSISANNKGIYFCDMAKFPCITFILTPGKALPMVCIIYPYYIPQPLRSFYFLPNSVKIMICGEGTTVEETIAELRWNSLSIIRQQPCLLRSFETCGFVLRVEIA